MDAAVLSFRLDTTVVELNVYNVQLVAFTLRRTNSFSIVTKRHQTVFIYKQGRSILTHGGVTSRW